MKYLSANKVLPKEVVSLIQEYIDGDYIYIPRKSSEVKSWGEVSGAKRDMLKRNREIQASYQKGIQVEDLSKKYFLAPSTIRKILWKMNKEYHEKSC